MEDVSREIGSRPCQHVCWCGVSRCGTEEDPKSETKLEGRTDVTGEG